MAYELPLDDPRLRQILAIKNPKVISNRISHRKSTVTKLRNSYTELKLIPIRLVTIEKVQKLLDDLNTSIQLLQALQHRYLELTTEGEHTSEEEVEANAIKEREQETLLEGLVDKLRLARAAK